MPDTTEAPSPSTFDPIAFSEAPTLPLLFERRCERSPQDEAYRQFDAGAAAWRSFTWGEMAQRVRRWRAALAREGLAPGERVAILLRNCTEWVCFDQAALSLGLVVVPLYATDNSGNLAYILSHCGARVLLVEDERRWATLAAHEAELAQLARVVCLAFAPAQGPLRCLDDWLADAPDAPPAHVTDPDALATIVYTSGTTGRPKGVMLSHRNILSNIDGVLRTVQVYREDLFLSFLPLSHALERTVGYYAAVATGSTVAFARSVQDLGEDLVSVRPTVLISVPRIYERVYARMQQDLQVRGAPARQLFDWAESIGWQRFEAAQHRGEPPGALAALMWPVLRHLVGDRLLARLGGRLRLAVSGGAPMSRKLTHCFVGLGLPLLQGYGLTETAPIVSANRVEDNVPESVGRPIPDVEVKLGERDELLVRGPNVMLGYWNDPQRTAETFTPDGWLRTGDIARIDDAGHIHIVGRVKEILVTSTGEKVPPADLEMAIAEDPLFEQVMVLGEGRPYIAALAVLNREAWASFSASLRIEIHGEAALHLPQVQEAVLRRIEERVASFPAWARVRQVWLTLQPWTTDDGLITPTLKLRRRQLQERFADAIGELYAPRG